MILQEVNNYITVIYCQALLSCQNPVTILLLSLLLRVMDITDHNGKWCP